MTLQEFARFAATLCKLWPHSAPSPATTGEWWHMGLFEDLAADDCRAALTALCASGEYKFYPETGVIRRWILDRHAGDDEATWAAVWRELQRNITYHGGYADPDTIEWSSPIVAELVRLVGWEYLCRGEYGKVPPPGVMEAQTREKWHELRARERTRRATEELPAVKAFGSGRLPRVVGGHELDTTATIRALAETKRLPAGGAAARTPRA